MEDEFILRKYPRTPHLKGSRLQPGDEDLSQVPFDAIAGRHLAVEEKIDGANSAISFDGEGQLLLQSRGHYLTGGYRERHFNLLKQWAMVQKEILHRVLGERYIMYGEWMYAKHTIFYDALPHYFMEFDIYDRENGIFLDTPSRQKLVAQMPVCSVPVLAQDVFREEKTLLSYLGDSNFKTANVAAVLRAAAEKEGLDAARALQETDTTSKMEGLYIKVEEGGKVVERLKFVRAEFMQCLLGSDSHWLDRPIIPNMLCRPVEELFLPELPCRRR